MRGGRAFQRSIVALSVGLLVVAPAASRGKGGLSALSRLERGQWQLRDLDTGKAYNVCVKDGGMLMHPRHGGSQCTWTVIRDEQTESTITYSCANGSGRTALRAETPRLAQIDSQGILNGVPYAHRIEARRAGSCRRGSR